VCAAAENRPRPRSRQLDICATENGYRVQPTEPLAQSALLADSSVPAAGGNDLAEKMISIVFGS